MRLFSKNTPVFTCFRALRPPLRPLLPDMCRIEPSGALPVSLSMFAEYIVGAWGHFEIDRLMEKLDGDELIKKKGFSCAIF